MSGVYRHCIWIDDEELQDALSIEALASRVRDCAEYRKEAGRDARRAAARPHAFCYSTFKEEHAIHVGKAIGNAYDYVPAALKAAGTVSSDMAFTIYRPQGHELAIVVSRLHRVWAEAVAGRLGNGTRYANTIVYNTFPLPALTNNNKRDLVRCASNILLARERHFPASLSELYQRGSMPENLKEAHDCNDETLERIYIGRRFKNDTERLEKLFDMYTRMTKKTKAYQEKGSRTA